MTNTETAALPLKSGSWTLDPYHSAVSFTIRHLGISKVRGSFTEFTSTLEIGETLDDIAITATIQLASIDTKNAQRDEHTRSADLLNVAARPTMTFRTTAISGSGEDYTMAGDLTIGDVTKPVSLDVEFGGVETGPDGKRHAGFEALGEIKRSAFGLNFAPGMLGDVIKITLDIQFIEPE